MKKLNGIVWGIVLVAAGVLLGLNAFGITDIDIFFDGWWTLFIIVPMGLVAFFAFTDKSGAFTLDNIARVGQYSNVFLRSIWLGALATFISLLLGYPLAYIIAKALEGKAAYFFACSK